MLVSYFFAALFLGLFLLPVFAQDVNLARPHEINAQSSPTAEGMRSRINNGQLQKDAQELADLCSSIVVDLNGLHQGMLPKDLPDKLRHVKKLSNKVQQELTP